MSLEHHLALRRVKVHGGFGGRSKGFPSWSGAAIRISCTSKVDEGTAHLVAKCKSFLCGSRHVRALEDVIEEEGDVVYINNIHQLYLNEKDGFKRHNAERMYTMLEDVSDQCRHVCRFIQNIVLKNI